MGIEERKLLLENVFERYAEKNLVGMESLKGGGYGTAFVSLMNNYILFRLRVSGGRYGTSMGSVGCETIKGFLDEIEQFDNMIDDYMGQYRGDLRWECRETMHETIDQLIFTKELSEGLKKEYDNRFFEEEELLEEN